MAEDGLGDDETAPFGDRDYGGQLVDQRVGRLVGLGEQSPQARGLLRGPALDAGIGGPRRPIGERVQQR